MSNWTAASKYVSEFVDKFLDRALGATNDPRQRVPVYDPLPNKFYVGKLLPEGESVGQSEYKAKVAPCSYIATFLIKGKPAQIRFKITPSFNLYFRTAIHKVAGSDRDADSGAHTIYSAQADPPLPAQSGRDDMWVDWQNRIRSASNEYISALQTLTPAKTYTGRRFRGKYKPDLAIDAYIRKRYCSSLDIELPDSPARAEQSLNLANFRSTYSKIGDSPEWSGKVEANTSPEGENTRIHIYLTNTFPVSADKTRKGDPNWYDTHLRVELLGGLELVPVPCPVLDKARGEIPSVYAESKNCAFDEINSTQTLLTFAPVARMKTLRRAAREVDYSFQESAANPQGLLEVFYNQLATNGASPATLKTYRQEIDLILGDNNAVEAVRMAARVYAKAIAEKGRWRFHQLATLIRSAAAYLERESGSQTQPKPIVLNVPTAGGKTEAFFASAMFCAFYELQRRRRSVNIIKYPMTLLSSDQVARLSRYSMIADEIAKEAKGPPLGIGYMVGKKGQFEEPSEVIERCPYPDASKGDGMCGESWEPFSVQGGLPTLKCAKGHILHLGIDSKDMLARQCPTFVVAIWDKFVSQSAQRKLALLFGADRYFCRKHGFLDFADAGQSYYKGELPGTIVCQVYEGNKPCGEAARPASPVTPGIIVFDEGHLIREASGTLDSHFETAYFQIASDLSGKYPIPIVSTATIAGIEDFLEQLGLVAQANRDNFHIMPEPEEQNAFFQYLPGEMQHETVALIPFDVMLTWAVPDLIDVFFETLAADYGYDATASEAQPLANLSHLRQIMVYCSSYKNINALAEMNRNAVAANRQYRGRNLLKTLQLSARYFSRVKAQKAIEDVRNVQQQIVYATNIASIGIDIENLDVIFFFGLPSNVSEFIQAMNRTGRRVGRPAICVAILGPNKERDMSYYRYWPQFIKGANQIIEPVPLNRFASSAVARTFNNIATAVMLMSYSHRSKHKLFDAGEVLAVMQRGVFSPEEVLAKLKHIYRAEADPAQEYSSRIEDLWNGYQARLSQAKYKTFLSDALSPEWMLSLRSISRPIQVVYPEVSELIEEIGSGSLFTGDVDSEATTDVSGAKAEE
ncbi:MAG: hypothetical protein KJ077_07595 [Anaerolineae bacterium]|nr:hypothetical protein [Anaerolineae bacterium]